MKQKYFLRFLGFLSDNLKSKIEKRPRGPKLVGLLAIALTLVFGGAVVDAQQTGKIFRIGFLDTQHCFR